MPSPLLSLDLDHSDEQSKSRTSVVPSLERLEERLMLNGDVEWATGTAVGVAGEMEVGESGAFHTFAVSPNGKLMVLGGRKGGREVVVRSVETGEVVRTIGGVGVSSVDILDDGTVVANGDDDVLRAWNADGSVKWSRNVGKYGRVDISPNGHYIVTGNGDSAWVLEMATGAVVRSITGQHWSGSIRDDGAAIVVNANTSGGFVWKADGGRESFETGSGPGYSFFSPDGSIIAVPVAWQSVKLVESGNKRVLGTLQDGGRSMFMGFTSDGNILAQTQDGRVQLWDITDVGNGRAPTVTYLTSATGKEFLLAGNIAQDPGMVLTVKDGGTLVAVRTKVKEVKVTEVVVEEDAEDDGEALDADAIDSVMAQGDSIEEDLAEIAAAIDAVMAGETVPVLTLEARMAEARSGAEAWVGVARSVAEAEATLTAAEEGLATMHETLEVLRARIAELPGLIAAAEIRVTEAAAVMALARTESQQAAVVFAAALAPVQGQLTQLTNYLQWLNGPAPSMWRSGRYVIRRDQEIVNTQRSIAAIRGPLATVQAAADRTAALFSVSTREWEDAGRVLARLSAELPEATAEEISLAMREAEEVETLEDAVSGLAETVLAAEALREKRLETFEARWMRSAAVALQYGVTGAAAASANALLLGEMPEQTDATAMQVVGVNGNQLVLEVASPKEGWRLWVERQDPDGRRWQGETLDIGGRTVSSETGTGMAVVPFHKGLHTGRYAVTLSAGGSMFVWWDAENARLSLTEESFPGLAGLGLTAEEPADPQDIAYEQAGAQALVAREAPSVSRLVADNPNIRLTHRERVWNALGLGVSNATIETMKREIGHAMAGHLIGATPQEDVLLREKFIRDLVNQGFNPTQAADSFGRQQTAHWNDAHERVYAMIEGQMTLAAEYLEHLAALHAGNASTFDMGKFRNPHALLPTGQVIRAAVEDGFVGLLGVRDLATADYTAMLERQEYLSVSAAKLAQRLRQEEREAHYKAARENPAAALAAGLAEEAPDARKLASDLAYLQRTLPLVAGDPARMQILLAQRPHAAVAYMESIGGRTDSVSRAVFGAWEGMTSGESFTDLFPEVVADGGDGMGGAEMAPTFWETMRAIGAEKLPQQHLQELLGNVVGEGHLFTSIEGQSVRLDTHAGLIFAGAYPLLRRYRSAPTSLARLAVSMEMVLGIDAQRIYGLNRLSDDGAVAEGMVRIFREYGYDVSQALGARDLGAGIEYRDGSVRVHINQPTGKVLDHVWVNVLHPEMDVVMRTNIAGPVEKGRMYIDVPRENLGEGGRLKVVAWWEGEGDSTTSYAVLPVDWSRVASAEERVGSSDLSTLPEGHPMREQEKAILSEVAANFPVENPSAYYWLLASGYHDGERGFASVDLNSLTGGDTDRGDPVLAVADGTIRIGGYTGNAHEDLRIGAISIEHTHANGQAIAWTSAYLHMPIMNTGVRAMVPVRMNGADRMEERDIYEILEQETIGDTVVATGTSLRVWDGKYANAKDPIGYLGGRTATEGGGYSEGRNNAHLHLQVYMGTHGIDLRKAMAEAGLIVVKASDGGPDENWESTADNKTLQVTWDINAQAWVNTVEQVILDRSDQLQNHPDAGNAQSWVAWHVDVTKRERVTHVNIGTPDSPIMRWITSTPPEAGKDVWNPITKEWATRADAASW